MTEIILIGFVILLVVFILYTRYVIRLILIPHKLLKARRLLDTEEAHAMKILSSILDIDRSNPIANWIMARLYMKRKQYILAQMYLYEIIYSQRYTDEITELDVRETLAYIYQSLGEFNKALSQYYLLKKHNKLTLDGMKKAIRLNIDNGDFSDAKTLISQAIELYGEDGELYYLDGLADFNKGNFKSSEIKLKRAIKRGYNRPEVKLLLGKTYFIMKKFKLALDYLNQLPTDYLNSTDIEQILGECFYYLKNYESAIKVLTRLLRDNKSPTAEPLFILGCAYESNGDIDKAIEVWEDIERRFSYYQPAQEKLNFYKKVVTDQSIRYFIVSPLSFFVKQTTKLLDILNYTIKEKIYEDDKTLEFICSYNKDLHSFYSYLVSVTRQTTQITERYISSKLLFLNKYRAKYLVIIAPFFSKNSFHFAKLNYVTLYDFSIYKENKLI